MFICYVLQMKKMLNNSNDRKRLKNLSDAKKLAASPGFRLSERQQEIVLDKYIELDKMSSSAQHLENQHIQQALEVLSIIMAEKARL